MNTVDYGGGGRVLDIYRSCELSCVYFESEGFRCRGLGFCVREGKREGQQVVDSL